MRQLLANIRDFWLCITSHRYPTVDDAMEAMRIAQIGGVRNSRLTGPCEICGTFHVNYGTNMYTGN